MRIKQPIYGAIAAVLLVAVLGFVVERILFLKASKKTTGTVSSISSTNSRCGGRRSRYSCTKFDAAVKFTPLNQKSEYNFTISAGSSRGHNRPSNEANYRVGQNVPVVYDPSKPTKAYQDSLFGVWGTPIMLFVFQIISFFTSLTEPKRREE